MKIFGVGADIVNINRIKKIVKKNSDFKKRIFTKNEIQLCEKKKNHYSCLAKRFAAKEAFSKALGTGISLGLNFNEIEVINNKLGKPSFRIKGNSLEITRKRTKYKKISTFLSLSDEKQFALATVIITN
jgi:holo-[acyl-carrier protein] synthase|tara:strand:+ start:2236 stop:2622 length:387 start_codon:yes stop_codon:yes gene_type:complete